MRLTDDLHQWHAGPVQIDEAHLEATRVGAVHEPAGVFLDVDAGDTGAPRLAPANELEMSVDRQRQIELRNLISLRQVWIEVVFAVELAEGRNRAVERHPGQDCCLD